MHLEYQALLQDNPELAGVLTAMPRGIFSGRKRVPKGSSGVFFCYSLPALDKETGEFTEEAGTARWYLWNPEREAVLEDPREIVESIRSNPSTPRKCATPEATLVAARAKVLEHIKDTYLKRVDAPLGVRATLKCWMELNED
jgi:hypothetical protein